MRKLMLFPRLRSLLGATAVAFIGLLVAPVTAQENADSPNKSASGTIPEELLQKLADIDRERTRLRKEQGGPAPAQRGQTGLRVLPAAVHLGNRYYSSSTELRYCALQLRLINFTSEPVVVDCTAAKLHVDGKPFERTGVPESLRPYGFRVGGEYVRLGRLDQKPRVTVLAGGTAATWVVFARLPAGNEIPQLVLELPAGDEAQRVDINEYAAAGLGLEVNRIGPKGVLGMLTISGKTNTVNIGAVVDALEKLATQKVARAVIRWSESAQPLDPRLYNRLRQAAVRAGREQSANNGFPLLPATIQELHLADVPDTGRNGSRQSGSSARAPRIHSTTAEAVSAALRDVYRRLPVDDLVVDLQQEDPLVRAAALAAGGSRLPADKLGLVLDAADDDDPRIQRSALIALRHFGEAEAVDKLLHHARKGNDTLQQVAAASLADSRYASAHDALVTLINDAGPALKKVVLQAMARFPRSRWSETVYELAANPDAECGPGALRALARIGHPRLDELLRKTLRHGEGPLQKEAFAILSSRPDPESEELVLNYTLKHIEDEPPTQPMLDLLKRTKDRRAVPLLLKHLDESDRAQSLINALAAIGGREVAGELATRYGAFSKHEKAVALEALRQLRSPRFRELARRALLGKQENNHSLVRTACRGLQNDGTRDAVRLLAEALAESGSAVTWNYAANSLGALGTPEARKALREARDSGNDRKRRYAQSALRNMQRQSPGYQYLWRAQHHLRQKNWQQAIENYGLALRLDPELAPAYSGRGNVLLRLGKIEQARGDFAKALELDPYDSQAVTGKALAMVKEGDYEKGIQYVEQEREKFEQDAAFAYNTACVYSRALAYVREHDEIADRDDKRSAYKKRAFSELKRAVSLGFRDFEWMSADPDLEPLRDDPAFENIPSAAGG